MSDLSRSAEETVAARGCSTWLPGAASLPRRAEGAHARSEQRGTETDTGAETKTQRARPRGSAAAAARRRQRGDCVGLALLQLPRLRLLHVLNVRLARPMQQVEKAEVAVVALELFVMKVVVVRLLVEAGRPWHPIPRVVDLRADDGAKGPHEREEDVAAARVEGGGQRDQVAYEELHRVAVDGHDADWRRELMVLLVEARVEMARVHRPVRVEEEHLVDDKHGDEVPEPLRVARQVRVQPQAELGVLRDPRHAEQVRQANEEEVRRHDTRGLPQLRGVKPLRSLSRGRDGQRSVCITLVSNIKKCNRLASWAMEGAIIPNVSKEDYISKMNQLASAASRDPNLHSSDPPVVKSVW